MEEEGAFRSDAAGQDALLHSLWAASADTAWELRTGTEKKNYNGDLFSQGIIKDAFFSFKKQGCPQVYLVWHLPLFRPGISELF